MLITSIRATSWHMLGQGSPTTACCTLMVSTRSMARDMDSWMQEKEELKHDGQGRLEVLVKWRYLPQHDSTWELTTTLKDNFPSFQLEDNLESLWGSIDKCLSLVSEQHLGTCLGWDHPPLLAALLWYQQEEWQGTWIVGCKKRKN
ncbi:hypothetical protein Lal_00018118 [Lupinus albus]|nr:hypothetical protein Lal_00018118 [Lupinus albus]